MVLSYQRMNTLSHELHDEYTGSILKKSNQAPEKEEKT